jgi:hypothetical protein
MAADYEMEMDAALTERECRKLQIIARAQLPLAE